MEIEKHKTEYEIKQRAFLNNLADFRELSSVSTDVSIIHKENNYAHSTIELRGCGSSQVLLEFEVNSKEVEETDNTEAKIKLFRTIINDFCDAIETNIKRARELGK